MFNVKIHKQKKFLLIYEIYRIGYDLKFDRCCPIHMPKSEKVSL